METDTVDILLSILALCLGIIAKLIDSHLETRRKNRVDSERHQDHSADQGDDGERQR
jgi:hypothetical protein